MVGPRNSLLQGDILINYGKDTVAGYFISVVDTRLSTLFNPSHGDDGLDRFRKKFSKTSQGTGRYLDAHTGNLPLEKGSRQIKIMEMKALWEVYGVPEEGMRLLSWTQDPNWRPGMAMDYRLDAGDGSGGEVLWK